MVRFWTGTKTVFTNFAEAKRELNRETVKSSKTLTGIQDFITKSSESIHSRVSRYTYMRKSMKEMNKTLANDYVTL